MPKTISIGNSYAARVKAVNDIYDRHVKSDISNRDIWRRYIISSIRHSGTNVIQLFETKCVYMIHKPRGMAPWRLRPNCRPVGFCFEPICGVRA